MIRVTLVDTESFRNAFYSVSFNVYGIRLHRGFCVYSARIKMVQNIFKTTGTVHSQMV